ncbi:hypothetical protein BDZ97DRAFT_1915512 [Flammula alnicola]|nr:hypothetical protein BDZ97DRAFT_1915512 [Flammula alnicola]
MSAKDAYRILDISEGASPDEIKNAYRIMALKWHPDRHHNSHDIEVATRHFLEVTNAYRTLVRAGHVKLQSTHDEESSRASTSTTPSSSGPPDQQRIVCLSRFFCTYGRVQLGVTYDASVKQASKSSLSWKQGVRKPAETMSAQYRHGTAARPHVFSYEGPPRGGGPALYTAPPSFSPVPQATSQATQGPKSSKATSTSTTKPVMSTPLLLTSNPIPMVKNRAATSNYNQPQPPPFRDQPNPRTQIPPYNIPLLSIGLGPSGEWVYSLSLTLEELFIGKHFRFGISRSPGTRILCRNVGHEFKPGAFQDIAFIIEEVPHDRFIRLFDDLIMDVRLPWVDGLRRQGGKVPFTGIDGRNLVIQIDYPSDKNMKGRSIVKGAGMPIRERGQVVGRGNLIVQWEILPPKTKILHFMRRLWGGK